MTDNQQPTLESLQKENDKLKKENEGMLKRLSVIKDSPYLPRSIKSLTFTSRVSRLTVYNNEYGKKIDETHATAHIFKERAREFAQIVGVDADSVRIALTEAIHNLFEYGYGDFAEINIHAEQPGNEQGYLQMSFKHQIEKEKFYSLKDADRNAETGIADLENDRGRGEFLMRELMDERKFINSREIDENGNTLYFFKRILRKYRNAQNLTVETGLPPEFTQYVDKLRNYQICLFLKLNYSRHERQLVVASDKDDFTAIRKIMNTMQYPFVEEKKYKDYIFSSWKIPPEIEQSSLDSLIGSIENV